MPWRYWRPCIRARRSILLRQTYAERQLEIDNLRESAYRQLMEIMALSGQRTEAMAVYEKCRRLFAEELGMAPSKRTTELYEQILDGDSASSRSPARGYGATI